MLATSLRQTVKDGVETLHRRIKKDNRVADGDLAGGSAGKVPPSTREAHVNWNKSIFKVANLFAY